MSSTIIKDMPNLIGLIKIFRVNLSVLRSINELAVFHSHTRIGAIRRHQSRYI